MKYPTFWKSACCVDTFKDCPRTEPPWRRERAKWDESEQWTLVDKVAGNLRALVADTDNQITLSTQGCPNRLGAFQNWKNIRQKAVSSFHVKKYSIASIKRRRKAFKKVLKVEWMNILIQIVVVLMILVGKNSEIDWKPSGNGKVRWQPCARKAFVAKTSASN